MKTSANFDLEQVNKRFDASTSALVQKVDDTLSDIFGRDTSEYRRYAIGSLDRLPLRMGGGNDYSLSQVHNSVAETISGKVLKLETLKQSFEERIEDAQSSSAALLPTVAATTSHCVFVVHGHDNEPKEAAARFLESLGFEAVILHERPNKGRTIIQKFREEGADVGFALVVMTPDDEMPSGEFRARQNVILELGFFLGQLGPDRVAALVKGKVETPSDYDGVLYIPYEAGWRMELAKEMQAAGYEIEWNKVMRK